MTKPPNPVKRFGGLFFGRTESTNDDQTDHLADDGVDGRIHSGQRDAMYRRFAAPGEDCGLTGGVFERCNIQSVVSTEHILASSLHLRRSDFCDAEHVHAHGFSTHPWNQPGHMPQLGIRWQFLGADARRGAPYRRLATFRAGYRYGRCGERCMLAVEKKSRLLPEGFAQCCDVAQRPRHLAGEEVQAAVLVQLRALCKPCGPVQKTRRKTQFAQQPTQARRAPAAVCLIRFQVRFPRRECDKSRSSAALYAAS